MSLKMHKQEWLRIDCNESPDHDELLAVVCHGKRGMLNLHYLNQCSKLDFEDANTVKCMVACAAKCNGVTLRCEPSITPVGSAWTGYHLRVMFEVTNN